MNRRTNILMRAHIQIAQAFQPEWGTYAAATYLVSKSVPLSISLRVLAGRKA